MPTSPARARTPGDKDPDLSNALKKTFGGRKGTCDRCKRIRRLCTLTDAASGFRKEVCRQCFRDIERWLNSQGMGVKFIDFKRG